MTHITHTTESGSSWLVDTSTRSETRLLCPRCASPLFRIRRRLGDRLLSLIVPIQRYRCSAQTDDLGCAWEGNLRTQPGGEARQIDNLDSNLSSTSYRAQRRPDSTSDSLRDTPTRNQWTKDSARTAQLPIAAFADVSFEDMAQITLDAIGDGVMVVDTQNKLIYLNKVAEKLTGWSSENALGRPVEEVFTIIDGKSLERRTIPSQRAIREDRIVDLALGSVLLRRDGSGMEIEDSAAPIHNRLGEMAGAVIIFHDARQSESQMQKMIHLAQHDALTGLPNRVLLKERLAQAIGMAKRHDKQVALLFLDLDHFKQINDSFGHAAGDHLLQAVAADIVACVRATDTVCRHGGDEFVVLLSEIEKIEDSTQVAEKLLARFDRPRMIDGHKLQVTLSIGISVYPENGLDADTLMRKADASMYTTKEKGRNSYEISR